MCPRCGSAISAEGRFCGTCGLAMAGPQPPAAPWGPPPQQLQPTAPFGPPPHDQPSVSWGARPPQPHPLPTTPWGPPQQPTQPPQPAPALWTAPGPGTWSGPVPTSPPRKRRSTGTWLVALVLLLVVAVGGYALLQAGGGKPTTDGGTIAGGDLGAGVDFDPLARPADIPAGPDLGEISATPPSPGDLIDSPWGSISGNTWWVMLRDGRTEADAQALLDRFAGADQRGSIAGRLEFVNTYQLRIAAPLSGNDYLLALEWLGEQPEVAAVTPDTPQELKGCADELKQGVYAAEKGADGAYGMIGVDGAWSAWWASGLPKNMVHVAVVDSAVVKSPANRPYEFDTVTWDGDPMTTTTADPQLDGFQHVDGVMGQIAADRGDGGISGIASPLGSSLVMSHFDYERSYGDTTKLPSDAWYKRADGTSSFAPEMVDAMAAVESGATVVNLSLGPPKPGPQNAGESAIWRAFAEKMQKEHPKVLFVVAAGNEGAGLDGRNYGLAGISAPNVITVGNVINTKELRTTSNRVDPKATAGDAEVTLAAPGHEAVWGTGASGTLKWSGGGTSTAAPMVTATAALLRSLDPSLTAAQLKERIVKAAGTGPSEVGGRILSTKQAVLDTVNAVRVTKGLKPLADADLDAIQQYCRITVTGDPGGEITGRKGFYAWKMNASLPTMKGPTAITLTIKDLRPADWRKAVSKIDQRVTWSLTTPAAGLPVVITRQDNGFWLRYVLKGTATASPTPGPSGKPTAKPTAKPTPKPTRRPTPTPDSGYDCSNPPPNGTIAYVNWSLHCKPIAP